MSETLRDRVTAVLESIADMSSLSLATLLTAILLLVSPGPAHEWTLTLPISVLVILSLIVPCLRTSARFWGVASLLLIAYHCVYNYYLSDNHKFVISGWCLAITIALCTPNPAHSLAWLGRVMVGLVFGLAVVWKATSLDYMSGHSFEFLLVTDPRFFALANLLGGLSAETYHANQAAVEQVRTLTGSIPIAGTEAASPLALFLTWWTIILETIIAALFLYDRSEKVRQWRHWILLGFIITTYPPTNVIQFGWILIAMAVASCPESYRRERVLYALSFLFILAFSTGNLREAFLRAGGL